jgi:hypothetical protein
VVILTIGSIGGGSAGGFGQRKGLGGYDANFLVIAGGGGGGRDRGPGGGGAGGYRNSYNLLKVQVVEVLLKLL